MKSGVVGFVCFFFLLTRPFVVLMARVSPVAELSARKFLVCGVLFVYFLRGGFQKVEFWLVVAVLKPCDSYNTHESFTSLKLPPMLFFSEFSESELQKRMA